PFRDRLPFKLLTARERRGGIAAVDAASGREFSYRQLGNRARRVAAALRGLGVSKGDRVAWSAPTSIDSAAIWLGISQIGAVDVCVGDAIKGKLLDHVLTDSAPQVLIMHGRLAAGIGGMTAEALAAF